MPSPARRPRPFVPILAVGLALLALTPVQAAAETVRRRISTASVSPPMRLSQDSYNRDVRIHNQTGWSMTYLYASAGGDWGEDLLGSGTLEPGQSVVVTIDDGSGACRYSLRAEFDNGQSLQRNGVNACEVADYYFTR